MTVTDSAPGTPATGPTTHEGVPLSAAVFAPGSDTDDGTGESGVDFFAGLKLQLGDLADTVSDLGDELQKWRKMQNEYPAMVQIVSVLTYSAVNPTAIVQGGGTGVGVLIGGPDQGRCWSVRNAVIGPVQVTGAAPAGAGYLIVSPTPPQDLSFTNVRAIAPTLPNVGTWSARELFLNPNENLYLVIANGTLNAQYVVACAVQDEPYRPSEGVISA